MNTLRSNLIPGFITTMTTITTPTIDFEPFLHLITTSIRSRATTAKHNTHKQRTQRQQLQRAPSTGGGANVDILVWL